MIIYYFISLVALTSLFWLLGRLQLIKICAICAAAVLTWTWGLIAIYLSLDWANPIAVAILLGASLGAIAERYGRTLGFLWKALWVILGLVAIFLLVQGQWLAGLGMLGLILLTTWFMSSNKSTQSKLHQDLFDDCC